MIWECTSHASQKLLRGPALVCEEDGHTSLSEGDRQHRLAAFSPSMILMSSCAKPKVTESPICTSVLVYGEDAFALPQRVQGNESPVSWKRAIMARRTIFKRPCSFSRLWRRPP